MPAASSPRPLRSRCGRGCRRRSCPGRTASRCRWSRGGSCAPCVRAGLAAGEEDLPALVARSAVGGARRPPDGTARLAGAPRRRRGMISTTWPCMLRGARVGRVHLRCRAADVVGEHGVDAAVDRVGLHVLRPVHRRRAEQVGGAARLDQHVGLAAKPLAAVSGPWPWTSGSQRIVPSSSKRATNSVPSSSRSRLAARSCGFQGRAVTNL